MSPTTLWGHLLENLAFKRYSMFLTKGLAVAGRKQPINVDWKVKYAE